MSYCSSQDVRVVHLDPPLPDEFRQIQDFERRTYPGEQLKFSNKGSRTVALTFRKGFRWYAALLGKTVQGYSLFDFRDDDAYLDDLGVEEGARRTGLAERLVSIGIEDAKKMGKRRVWAKYLVSNEGARRLYVDKLGFTAFGDVEDDGLGAAQKVEKVFP